MDKEYIKNLVDSGLSSREIAKKTTTSQTTVRYWLNKFGLKTKHVKRSIIYNILNDDDFKNLVLKSRTMTQILNVFSLQNKGGNAKTIKRRCDSLSVNYSHLSPKNRTGRKSVLKSSDIFTKDSKYSGKTVKRRILRDKLLKDRCAMCGMKPMWNGKPIVLRLDHINGVSVDHSPSNLRLICPNCDSQLPTFAGRNKKFSK